MRVPPRGRVGRDYHQRRAPFAVGMTPGVLPLAVQSRTHRSTRRSCICGGIEWATWSGGSADVWSARPPPRLLPAVAPPGREACPQRAECGRNARPALGAGCPPLDRQGQACGRPTPACFASRAARHRLLARPQPVTSMQCERRVSRGTPNNEPADPAFGSKQSNTQAGDACTQ